MFHVLISKLGAAVAAVGVLFTSLFTPVVKVNPQLPILQKHVELLQSRLDKPRLGSFNAVQAQKFKLAGSGITATATSITLQSFKLPDASTTITMSDFGTVGYGTIEPGTSKEEQISFTGVSQNGNGTATLTGVTRGLSFTSSCAETTANKKSHAGGTIFVLSNTNCFYGNFPVKSNAESITGAWTFASSSIPRLSAQGTYGSGAEEYLATKRYVDGVAISGASDASLTQKGLVEQATKAEVTSGASAGGTTAPLFVPANYFNATSSATTTVPVTNTSGKLSQGFLDLTQGFTFSGGVTSTATTTLSTTTFSVIPTAPTTTPTLDQQLITKSYADTFVHNSGEENPSTLSVGTSTTGITITVPSGKSVYHACTFKQASEAQSHVYTLVADSTNGNDFLLDANLNEYTSLVDIWSGLSAGSHTFKLSNASAGGGTTQAQYIHCVAFTL